MRLKIQVSIVVGDATVLNAETITVSQHGASIRVTSRGQLTPGERLRISAGRGQEAQPARVVWLDKRLDPHYGIELEAPGNFWGVYFPGKDGTRRSERKDVHRIEAVPPPSPTEPQLAPQLGAEEKPELAPQIVVEEKAKPAPLIQAGHVPAIVAGFSAIRLPFSERVEIVFDDPKEGIALLQNLVEPGTTLRVSFPDRKSKARVLAIGRRPEAGKWRVRIRCEAAGA